jgi:hypothetical protein
MRIVLALGFSAGLIASAPYPALDPFGGRTAIIGDIYRWKPGGSPNKLPRY